MNFSIASAFSLSLFCHNYIHAFCYLLIMKDEIVNEGSWIFISHSSKDIEKIRLIRNEFEKWGQNPLAFHLKCLNTDTEENERFLYDLIKKEIEARNWFVYCESESSKTSKNVQLEREYVKKVGKVQIWKLDLGRPIDEVMEEIKEICRILQVYISYSNKDKEFVNDLSMELKKNDFSVWNDDLLTVNYLESMSKTMTSIAKEGLFLCIMTGAGAASPYVWKELEVAKANGALILVFIFDNAVSLSDDRFRDILPIGKTAKGMAYLNLYSIPCLPRKEEMFLIANLVLMAVKRSRANKKISLIYDMAADALNVENQLQEKLNYDNRYHPEKPVTIGNGGALLDYCEYYLFPCCGKIVTIGDGKPSQNRCDGCKKYLLTD